MDHNGFGEISLLRLQVIMLRTSLWKSMVAAAVIAAAPLSVAHAEAKIGVVDFGQLMRESPQLKSAMEALQNEFAPRQRELQQLQTSLKNKADKLQKDAAVMTDAERNNIESDIRSGQRELDRRGKEFQEDGNQRQNDEIAKVQRVLVQEVGAFAKNTAYDLILDKATVVYAKDAADITPQVLASIQQRTKSSSSTPATKPTSSKP
jgi:outer membrane protein